MSTVNIGNSTNNPVPVNVNAALPAGGNNIGAVNIQAAGTAINLGQTTMSSSVPVTIASDQSAVKVGGGAASGASNTGNPVKVGGAFNTTQPTVTNGQAVDAQYTARGAAIVSTGVDTFNVTVNAALPTGSNVIGALSANQSVNMAQVGGSNVSLGQAAMASSIPVVIASNQSAVSVSLGSNNSTMIGVTSPGGISATAIAAAATNTVVKASAGRLCRVLVSAVGTAALTFYDNATGGSTTGNILGVIPANAATGSVYDFQFIASTGIQAPGGAGTPAVTVGYI